MISRTCSYAIRATLYLAIQPKGAYVPVKRIADTLGISFHFLTKILQTLTAEDILSSSRGPHGGVRLARGASSIHMSEIVYAMDGRGIFETCVLGLERCGDDQPCPVHEKWAIVRGQIAALFETTTLEKMAQQVERKGLRLANIVLVDSARTKGKAR